MYFGLLHFMYHGFYSMTIQFINKHCIIMMYVWLNDFIYCIAEKKRFVTEIDLNKHKKDKVQEIRTLKNPFLVTEQNH